MKQPNYLDQDACLSPYNKFMKDYDKLHKYCPRCGHEHYVSTLMAFTLDLNNTENYRNENNCTCNKCGDKHIVHDRVENKNLSEQTMAITLLDSAYDIIMLYKTESPSQEEWKNWWLKTANNLIHNYVEKNKL